jgi:iron complex outermembrane receptor protein
MNNLEYARQIFHSGDYAFVLVKDMQVLASGAGDGIGELLEAIVQHGEAARGATLADKIVGKAVAMVAVYSGLAEVYTPLASEPALWMLQEHGIALAAEHLAPLIRNKRNDGPCPMEQLTLPLSDPAEAFAALREFASRGRPAITVQSK